MTNCQLSAAMTTAPMRHITTKNPHLEALDSDFLYHLGLSSGEKTSDGREKLEVGRMFTQSVVRVCIENGYTERSACLH